MRLVPSLAVGCSLGFVLLSACASGGSSGDDPALGGNGAAGTSDSGGSDDAGGAAGASVSTGGAGHGGTSGGSGGAKGGASGGGGHAGSTAGHGGTSTGGASGTGGTSGGSAGAMASGGAAGSGGEAGMSGSGPVAGAGGDGGSPAGTGGAPAGPGGAPAGAGGSPAGGAPAGGSSGTTGGASGSGTAGAAGAAGATGGGGSGGSPTVVDVTSTTPADGASSVAAGTTVTVTFSGPVLATSLVTQAATGPCSGSVQLSCDGFTTCVGATSVAGGMDDVLTPAAPLPDGATCKVQVTTAAQAADGTPLASAYTSPAGFTIASMPGTCGNPDVVISAVYGGGGNMSATFNTDYIELFNRSTHDVSLAGWSIQYAAATGKFTSVTLLKNTIPAGRYFLIAESSGATGANLPTPDLLPMMTFNLSATAGKIALVSDTAAISSCTSAKVVDLIGFGTTADCSEGGLAKAPTSGSANVNKTAIVRAGAGCADTNANDADFALQTPPVPRNGMTAVQSCSCP